MSRHEAAEVLALYLDGGSVPRKEVRQALRVARKLIGGAYLPTSRQAWAILLAVAERRVVK